MWTVIHTNAQKLGLFVMHVWVGGRVWNTCVLKYDELYKNQRPKRIYIALTTDSRQSTYANTTQILFIAYDEKSNSRRQCALLQIFARIRAQTDENNILRVTVNFLELISSDKVQLYPIFLLTKK